MVHTALCCTAQPCLTLRGPVDCSPPGSSVPGILQARILEWGAMPSSRDLPDLGVEPRSPALQVDSLPAEPQGKPRNTGVSSLSLLQWIFLTQESNWGLLHCRQILYQLSYQGHPHIFIYICTYTHTHITYIHICNTYSVLIICNIHIISVIPSGCKRENQFPRLFLAERKPEGSPKRF